MEATIGYQQFTTSPLAVPPRAAPSARPRIGLSAILLALVLLGTAPDRSRAEIAIGVAAPLSGQFAAFGEDIRLGVEFAVNTINSAGGISGERVRAVFEDDKCSEDGGRDAANRLIGAQVQAIIGHLCWRASIAGSVLYHANGLVQISPATRYGKYTDERPDPLGGTYRLIGRSDAQAQTLSQWIVSRYSGLRIAIAHDNSPYGRGLATEVQKQLAAKGLRDILFVDYEPGRNNYRSLVSTFNDALVEMVLVCGYAGDAAAIVRDMRARDITVPVLGADALANAEFWTIAGTSGEGTMFSAPADPRQAPGAAELRQRLAERDRPLQPYSVYAYAAVEVLAQAFARTQSRDYAALSEALNTQAFSTVLGEVRFDANGDADVAGYTMFRWSGGSVQPLPQ